MKREKAPNVHKFVAPQGHKDTQLFEYIGRFFEPFVVGGASLLELLVKDTNSYYQYYMRQNPVLKPHAKVGLWKDFTVSQMKAFIGVLLNMGINRKLAIDSYWNTTNWSKGFPMFSEVFKQHTFKLIMIF